MNKSARFRKVTIIIAVVFSTLMLSCSSVQKTEAEKTEIEMQNQDEQAMQELRKAERDHYNMQPRETKKMMKRTKKMARKANKTRGLRR